MKTLKLGLFVMLFALIGFNMTECGGEIDPQPTAKQNPDATPNQVEADPFQTFEGKWKFKSLKVGNNVYTNINTPNQTFYEFDSVNLEEDNEIVDYDEDLTDQVPHQYLKFELDSVDDDNNIYFTLREPRADTGYRKLFSFKILYDKSTAEEIVVVMTATVHGVWEKRLVFTNAETTLTKD